ncbi:hypothetical protein C8R44DRAFT_860647 [Mycena epipterygia]|nr:hypothetical protein C8R44DRAFT_860647 [Mycena epipterygia]
MADDTTVPITLPEELQREIVELAASLHPGTIPSLILVATHVQSWAESLLYRVVVATRDRVHPERPVPSFVAMKAKQRQGAKGADFLKSTVHHVYMDLESRNGSVEAALALMPAFASLTDLLVFGQVCGPKLLNILSDKTLRRFGGHLSSLFGSSEKIDLTHKSLASLTHIDIFDSIQTDDTHIWPHLGCLKALTHLALPDRIPDLIISLILSENAFLEVFVNLWSNIGTVEEQEEARRVKPPNNDIRFIVTTCPNQPGDWERGARGGADFWIRAKEFIARKQGGEIEGNVRVLDGGRSESQRVRKRFGPEQHCPIV